MAALALACRAWQERVGNEIDATVDVLRDIRGDRSVSAKAIGRRLRTYLVQVLLFSLPAQRSLEGYLAWLSTYCPKVDREERAQHLLAYSKWVPNPKKKTGAACTSTSCNIYAGGTPCCIRPRLCHEGRGAANVAVNRIQDLHVT